MKQVLSGILLTLMSLNCIAGEQALIDTENEVAAAKQAISQLATSLQQELKTAMQAGGPVAAIGVCNVQAIPLTRSVASAQGLHLSRVSLKERNPLNRPNDWQSGVLEDFERRRNAGEDITKLTWSGTVSVEGGQEFRFMKAIPTSAVCLNCHGTGITPEVIDVLEGLYPDDRATGYREGDLRGAFVVTRTLSGQPE